MKEAAKSSEFVFLPARDLLPQWEVRLDAEDGVVVAHVTERRESPRYKILFLRDGAADGEALCESRDDVMRALIRKRAEP